jgi:DNA-binding NarL/FixJ family response regulator
VARHSAACYKDRITTRSRIPAERVVLRQVEKTEVRGRAEVRPERRSHVPATVLVADDHAMFRSAIRSLIEDGRFVVCAEAGDADAAVAAAIEHRPDLCLLDILMPGGGLEAAARIAEAVPAASVVMLTASDEEAHLFAAVRAGAAGYLLKTTDPGRLADALAGVLDGEAAIPRTLVARLLREFRAPGRLRHLRPDGTEIVLTPRESEIAGRLARGETTATIADQLGIKAATVRTHLASVQRKLGAADRGSVADIFGA